MDESIKDLQAEQLESYSRNSNRVGKTGKVFPDASSSVEALQALQLMIKDIVNIKDPVEASAARKECYSFYSKIVDQMEPADVLRIREDSKRFMQETSLKARRLLVGTISFLILLLSLLYALVTNRASGVVLEVLLALSTLAFFLMSGLSFLDTKQRK